jgi:hypothetical protein
MFCQLFIQANKKETSHSLFSAINKKEFSKMPSILTIEYLPQFIVTPAPTSITTRLIDKIMT